MQVTRESKFIENTKVCQCKLQNTLNNHRLFNVNCKNKRDKHHMFFNVNRNVFFVPDSLITQITLGALVIDTQLHAVLVAIHLGIGIWLFAMVLLTVLFAFRISKSSKSITA